MRDFAYPIRFLMVLFWLSLFIAFLYAPYLGKILSKSSSITVLVWADMIDPQLLHEFEKETGIKVNLRYFESNEELFAKLLASRAEGFDVIIPSDYIVDKLIKNDLIKPIDKNKLPFFNEIDKKFLNHYYDPENKFSIPYHWTIYGIGINKDFFKQQTPESNWGILFKQYPHAKIQMPDAARESCLITANYLFGQIDNLNTNQLKEIKRLLIKQKKWVEAYADTDVRADYFLTTETCPLVVVSSSFIAKSLNNHSTIDFIIPEKSTFTIIDNILISAKTTRDEYIYQFINYLFKNENLKHHLLKYPFMPTTKVVWSLLDEYFPRLSQTIKNYKGNYEFFKNTINESNFQNIWLAVKVT